MFASSPYSFAHRGVPAVLYVLRHDGYCWGRIVTQDGAAFDVTTARDYYERPDDVAARAFARRALRTQLTSAFGWEDLPFSDDAEPLFA